MANDMTEVGPAAGSDISAFTEFDTVAERESRAKPPEDFTQSITRLNRLIDKLPQRAAIKDDDARNWLEKTLKMAVKRMELEHGQGNFTVGDVHSHVLWHVRRASGIGGSDASTVLKHYRGERGTFGDANGLVREKLLMLAPQPSTDVMARGVRAEPWIQKISHETFKTRTDDASLAKLRGFRPAGLPAAVGTPDDICVPALIEGNADDVRDIDDYKAPSALVMEEYDKDGVSFDYVCQLHHYGFISREAGVAFRGMSIKALDPRSFTIAVFPVPFDEELRAELKESIDRIWNEHVMLGIVPDAPKPDVLPVEDEEILRIAVEAAMMKIFMDDSKARHDDLKKRISAVSGIWHDLATGNMDLKIGAFSRRRAWKEAELITIAEQAGVDPDDFRTENPKKLDADKALKMFKELAKAAEKDGDIDKIVDRMIANPPYEQKLDTAKLAEHLEDMDISVVEAMDVAESLRLSTKKKGPEADRLATAREEVSRLMGAIEGVMGEAVDMVLSSDEQKEVDEPDYDPEIL